MLTRTSAQLVTKISIHESPPFGKEFLYVSGCPLICLCLIEFNLISIVGSWTSGVLSNF